MAEILKKQGSSLLSFFVATYAGVIVHFFICVILLFNYHVTTYQSFWTLSCLSFFSTYILLPLVCVYSVGLYVYWKMAKKNGKFSTLSYGLLFLLIIGQYYYFFCNVYVSGV